MKYGRTKSNWNLQKKMWCPQGELEAVLVSYWVLCHGAKHTFGPGVEKPEG